MTINRKKYNSNVLVRRFLGIRRYIIRSTVQRTYIKVSLSIPVVLFLVFISCSNSEVPTAQKNLSIDEQYLVDAYVRIISAGDLYASDSTKAESLFTVIDSTLDSLRIANTINTLNRDPDRWINIFKTINKRLQEKKKQKQLQNPGLYP